jgi:anti-sigma regulatory factor (Ser/Thr protein kinase)
MKQKADPAGLGDSRRTLSVDIAASPAAPSIARSALSGLAADHPGAASHLDALTLLISEVVTNAVSHVDPSPGRQVELEITVTDERTRIDVRDQGHGFRPRAERPPGGRKGGFGLRLVEQAASRWGSGMNEGRFSVWFEIDHARRPNA